jgi:hypothetical protein
VISQAVPFDEFAGRDDALDAIADPFSRPATTATGTQAFDWNCESGNALHIMIKGACCEDLSD